MQQGSSWRKKRTREEEEESHENISSSLTYHLHWLMYARARSDQIVAITNHHFVREAPISCGYWEAERNEMVKRCRESSSEFNLVCSWMLDGEMDQRNDELDEWVNETLSGREESIDPPANSMCSLLVHFLRQVSLGLTRKSGKRKTGNESVVLMSLSLSRQSALSLSRLSSIAFLTGTSRLQLLV